MSSLSSKLDFRQLGVVVDLTVEVSEGVKVPAGAEVVVTAGSEVVDSAASEVVVTAGPEVVVTAVPEVVVTAGPEVVDGTVIAGKQPIILILTLFSDSELMNLISISLVMPGFLNTTIDGVLEIMAKSA